MCVCIIYIYMCISKYLIKYIYNDIYIYVYVVGAKMFLNIKLPNHASRGFKSPLNILNK